MATSSSRETLPRGRISGPHHKVAMGGIFKFLAEETAAQAGQKANRDPPASVNARTRHVGDNDAVFPEQSIKPCTHEALQKNAAQLERER